MRILSSCLLRKGPSVHDLIASHTILPLSHGVGTHTLGGGYMCSNVQDVNSLWLELKMIPKFEMCGFEFRCAYPT